MKPEAQPDMTLLAVASLLDIKSVFQQPKGCYQCETFLNHGSRFLASFSLADHWERVVTVMFVGVFLFAVLSEASRGVCQGLGVIYWRVEVCIFHTCMSSADQQQYQKPGCPFIHSLPDGFCDYK